MLKLETGLIEAIRFLTGHDPKARGSINAVKQRNEPLYVNLQDESNRLKTFENWPVNFIDKNQLALLGFYYRNQSDLVKCFFCGVEIGVWEEGDDILTDHIRWAPRCELINGTDTHNIPINATLLKEVLQRVPVGVNDANTSLNTTSEGSIDDWSQDQRGVGDVSRENQSATSATPAILKPKYPEYAVEINRIESYKQAPSIIKMKALELSDAGFYYTNIDDQVSCFHCGGGFKDWADNDDAWQLHAEFYGKCAYLNLMKDSAFIEKAAKLREMIYSKAECCPAQADQKIDEIVKQPQNSSKNPTAEEAEEKEDSRLCKICFNNEVSMIYLPCRHIVTCKKCTASLLKPQCPACRQPIESVLKVFFS